MYITLQMLFFILVVLMNTLKGEIFTSVYKLSILAREEGHLIQGFKSYIDCKTEVGEQITFELQRLFSDLESVVSDSSSNPSYAENPINSFHLIGRFVYKWPAVYIHIFCEGCVQDHCASDLNKTFDMVSANIFNWPNEIDVRHTAEAILRLRVFYYFDIGELIDGTLFGEVVLPLSPSQVIKIIEIAVYHYMFNEAKLWCETLLSKIHFSSHLDERVNWYTVLRLLAGIYNKAGMPGWAAETLQSLTQKGIFDIDLEYAYYKNQSHSSEDKKEIDLAEWEYDSTYKQLCRENVKSSAELSELYCHYSNTTIPYYKGKVEVVNLNPKIVLFHDVLSDTEILYLQNLSGEKFKRSEVVGEDGVSTPDNVRVSQTAWINDSPGVVQKAANRVGLLTGLNTKSTEKPTNVEAFQIVNYGIGGMYHPHYDSLDLNDEKDNISTDTKKGTDSDEFRGSGDRIATWIYYLNDVHVGGATVFPNVNTRVPVVKGGAAFWYNLLPSGQKDKRTLHAGCPVVIGSKWIGNKWIRENGQMFRRPCDLQP